MYRKTVLPSGLRIVTEAMPSVRSVTIGVWADVGSAAERPEQRGISHLVEHMLFKGTARRSARQIAEEMDGVGGHLNAFTDKETTCYYAKVVDRHLPLAIDVLSDMVLHASFAPDELAKEQKVVLEEIRMYDDSPDEMIHDLFTRAMWKGSNLGEPTIGYANTVAALRRDDLLEHVRRRHAPNTVLVAAAGNVDHDQVVALVADAFAPLAGHAEPPAPEHPTLTPGDLLHRKETEQTYIVIGTQGLSARDDRRYVLAVLDTILGGGMSSRLFQEIREKRGLAYSVYTFQQPYREAGLFAVYVGTSSTDAQECVNLALAELHDVASGGVRDAEVRLAKEHLKGSLTLSLESSSARMLSLGRNELALGRDVSVEEIEERVDAVGRDDVVRLAAELFRPEQIGLCVLGPVEEGAVTRRPTQSAVA